MILTYITTALTARLARRRVSALTTTVAQLRAAAELPGLAPWKVERAYQRVNLAVNALNRWRVRLGLVPVCQYA